MVEGKSESPIVTSELEPHCEDLLSLLGSEQPLQKLAELCKKVPGKVKHEVLARLRRDMDQGEEKRLGALVKLTWLCLPQLNQIIQNVRGWGIEDSELLEQGMVVLEEEILDWEPPDRLTSSYHSLRRQVAKNGSWKMASFVAGRYGLSGHDLPVVQLYVRCRGKFLAEDGREAGREDLKGIRSLVSNEYDEITGKGETFPSLSFVQKRDNPWEGDKIAQIHAIYMTRYFSWETGEQDLVADDPVREAVETTLLIEELNRQLRTLSLKEEDVMRLLYGDGLSQSEAGRVLRITREQVRQIEYRALRKLNHPDRKRKLADFAGDRGFKAHLW